MPALTADGYRELMDLVQSGCRVFNACTATITDEELAEASRIVEVADATGFVLDPTAYRTALGDGRLDRQRALIKAARDFRAALRAIEAMR